MTLTEAALIAAIINAVASIIHAVVYGIEKKEQIDAQRQRRKQEEQDSQLRVSTKFITDIVAKNTSIRNQLDRKYHE